jgi:hypothetical protein
MCEVPTHGFHGYVCESPPLVIALSMGIYNTIDKPNQVKQGRLIPLYRILEERQNMRLCYTEDIVSTNANLAARPKVKSSKKIYWIIGLIAVGIYMSIFAVTGNANSSNNSNNTSPTTDTSSARLLSWYKSYGSVLTAITNSLNDISTGPGSNSKLALLADCKQIQLEVTAAQNDPPMPVADVNEYYSDAFTTLGSAASDCVQGIDNNWGDTIIQSNNEFSEGRAVLNIAETVLQQYE